MVLVNGEKFKIYELDTINFVKRRLSIKMKTLPKYLYFPNGISYHDLRDDKNNIIVKDVLKDIKKASKKNKSIIDLIEGIKLKLSVKDDIIKIWLSYNNNVNIEEIGKLLVEKKYLYSISELDRLWKNRNSYKEELKKNIEYNKEQFQYRLKVLQEFENIEDGIVYTEFNLEYTMFELLLKELDNITLLELFNYVRTTETVPFLTVKKFFKILKDFIPPEEWSETSDDYIKLKVSHLKSDFISSHINYTDVVIRKEEGVKMDIIVRPEKNNLSLDEFINRTLGVFEGLDVGKREIKNIKVVGTFYFPLQILNNYVFADLVMNDDLFSSLINIDESEKATKKREGLYIVFDHPVTGIIRANMVQKMMVQGDIKMRDVDPDLFPVNNVYISVRVTYAKNEESVLRFQEILSKLFEIYEKKYNDIVAIYKEYLPDFSSKVQFYIEEEKQIKLKDIAPDLFVSNYSRSCRKMPTIISEQQYLTAKKEGKSVIKFPRDIPDDPEAIRFPKDGQNQEYYICNHDSHKYVSVKENNLANADIYPYVPCCFKTNQTKKPEYLNYFEGKIIGSKIETDKDIIKTGKILDHNSFGVLHPNIENMFYLVNPNPDYVFYRQGVSRNESSFLNVILKALDKGPDTEGLDDDDSREAFLIDIRQSLVTTENAALCRQELYDKTIQEIMEDINNPEIYLDPKKFIHLLEGVYKCNIFIFTNGVMVLPRHLQAYYKNRNTYPCIYVYETIGDKPQCELIVRYKIGETEPAQGIFSYNESKNIRGIYNSIRQSFILDKPNNEIDIDKLLNNKSIKIISQWIDSYGKTRKLNIKFKGEKITLILSPIQPIKIKETRNNKIYYSNIELAKDLVNELKTTIEYQTTIESIVKEISCILGNVNVSIPVKDSSIIEGISIKQHGISYISDKTSELQIYNRNKKLSRYLVEYVFWIYSKYLFDSDIEEINDENIARFAKNMFEIDSSYIYKDVPKVFTESSTFIKNGKIIVHSEEIVKRLVYVLKLTAKRNRDVLLQYRTRNVINNYYIDITDFDTYSNQVILFGEESIDKWISDNNITYTFYDKILIGTNSPYFFKNNLIDNNIYLAQNSSSLEKACDISVSWFRKDYNIGIHAKGVTPVSFTLYTYTSSSDINKISILGENTNYPIKIIGYKIDNITFYTSLLPLNNLTTV